jgi:hypothetical protein
MGKFLIIIGIIYFLYYAGMIIYDLFIKKEVVVNPDDTQVFLSETTQKKIEKSLKR